LDWRCTALQSVIAGGRQASIYGKSESGSKTRICLTDDKAGDNKASRPAALFEQHTGRSEDWRAITSKIPSIVYFSQSFSYLYSFPSIEQQEYEADCKDHPIFY
jgi:hypothetical protein